MATTTAPAPRALLTGAAAHDAVSRLRAAIRSCPGGLACPDARTTCVAGVHLFPDALNRTSYPTHLTGSGRAAMHSDPACRTLNGRPVHATTRTWTALVSNQCRVCGTTPTEVTEARTEARRVSSSVAVIARAAAGWPGRLTGNQVENVTRAVAKLNRTKVRQFRALVDLALAVAELLLAGSATWTPPPMPAALLGAAGADLIGVDDDPFYRSGRRPRTAADRAAAEVASADQLDRLWTAWRDTVRQQGLDADLTRVTYTGQSRPAHQDAIGALVDAWTEAARALVSAGDQQIVAVPPGAQSGRSEVTELAALAAMTVPTQVSLVVVPAAVARWLSRLGLRPFEVIGPWPGDEIGVVVVETLVRLADGDPYRMPDLLPVAVDFVTPATDLP